MITAVCLVGYILIGLVAARGLFVWAVKHGEYENRYKRTNTHINMGFTAVLWPVALVVFACFGVGKLLTARPPKSPRQIEEEQREQERYIRKLERELGL